MDKFTQMSLELFGITFLIGGGNLLMNTEKLAYPSILLAIGVLLYIGSSLIEVK